MITCCSCRWHKTVNEGIPDCCIHPQAEDPVYGDESDTAPALWQRLGYDLCWREGRWWESKNKETL